MPEDKTIEEALRRLESCCIQEVTRGGKIVKIPPQRDDVLLLLIFKIIAEKELMRKRRWLKRRKKEGNGRG